MNRIKIKDYNFQNPIEEEKITVNKGTIGALQLLSIKGITNQTIFMKISNDGQNWERVKDGNNDFTITADTIIPLLPNDCYLALESEDNISGIEASIGLKKGV